MVSASDDNTLRLWDAASGQCLATWVGHSGPVQACAFSPDGARVVSASRDNSLRLWDAASGQLLRVHQLGPKGSHAVWDEPNQGLIEASESAWPWLTAQVRDAAGRVECVLPVEAFGELPLPQRLSA
ncbi:hypothetical protein KAK06_04075 [Ideonella sp. 4Y11]|uniref:WD40 repeat domain-containing protein n=2 Tax=Ideonella aquatica TaxID=2824119 RepID=A0A940YDD4_9BURK|nr:hypothetical protein [Ideonella aquatica]